MNERHRTALVTGGSLGIGRAVAARFAAEGMHVVSLDLVEPEPGWEPGGVTTVVGDAAREDDVRRAVDTASTSGGLDVLVCNAAVACVGPLDEIEPEQFDRAVAVNVRGPYLAVRAALPWLRRSAAPAIVLVSSNAGLVGRASDPVYSATKFAVQGLVRSLAIGLAGDRVRVNAVCPGPVDTPGLWGAVSPDASQLPEILRNVPLGRALGRMASADEVADAVIFLCSEQAAFVTGALLPVDGGKAAGLEE
jgi:NAD(P)-dependent dehydrogenase (short-subunit alcohol dehydrogenase family)